MPWPHGRLGSQWLWPPVPSRRLGTVLGLGWVLGPPCRLPDEEKAKQDPSYYLKNTNTETRETLQELYKEFKGDEVLAATMRVPEKAKVDQLNAVSRGPLPRPGGTPGAWCWAGGCRQPPWFLATRQPGVRVGTAARSQSDPGVPSCQGDRWCQGVCPPALTCTSHPRPCAWPWAPVGREGTATRVLACQALSCPCPMPGRAWGWETRFKQLSRKPGVLKTRVCSRFPVTLRLLVF